MVLARLLTPEDFGLIIMITAITGFVMLFRDLGLGVATVQKDQISHEQVSTLFWINVLLNVAVMVVTMALAPVIVWFYDQPELFLLTIAMATGFIWSGLSVQHMALLRRQMRFGTIAGINILATAVSVAAGISAALSGWGVWSLVVMPLAGSITGAAAMWMLCSWRPGLPKRHADVRDMLAFGGNLTGFSFVTCLSQNMDNLLIGKVWGTGLLGLYNKAYELLLLPLRQINRPLGNVVVTTLSRLQNDPQQFRTYYQKGTLAATFFGMPIVLLFFVAATELIAVFLGDQWIEVPRLFRVLMPAAFVSTFNTTAGWVFVATGQANRQLRIGSIIAIAQVIGFCIGIQWGPIGVAASFSIVSCLTCYPTFHYCFKKSSLCMTDLTTVLWKPALASLFAATLTFTANEFFFAQHHVMTRLILTCGIFAFSYLLAWTCLPNGFQTLRELCRILQGLRTTRK